MATNGVCVCVSVRLQKNIVPIQMNTRIQSRGGQADRIVVSWNGNMHRGI